MPPDSGPVIEAQLQRILASETFLKARRQRQLLRFLISESLAGRSADLKETLIGSEVFGKDAGYDNTKDGLVRTTAARLRKRLCDYYSAEGRSDPCLIQLPPDGYIPIITLRSKPTETRPMPGRGEGLRRGVLAAVAITAISAIIVHDASMALLAGSRRPHANALLVTETDQVTDDRRPKRGPVLFDGRRLWFEEEIDGAWRIVSVSGKGGEVTPLAVSLKDVRLQDLAVDGSALLLSGDESGARTLWSWPLSGGSPQILPPETGEAGWAPDRSAIALVSLNTLTLAPAAGPPSSRPLAPAGVLVRDPRWSPNGEQITFRLQDQKTTVSGLWLSDRRGDRLRPVPGAKDTGEDQRRGIWTRDGRYYLFAGGSLTNHDLWVLPNPGAHVAKPSRLTHGPGNWDWPTPGRETGELFAMGESIQGNLVSRPQPGSSVWRPYLGGIHGSELDFSRDGAWVVYVHYPDHALWKVRVDGSQPSQLTSSADLEAHQPHWSPEGTRIAFMGQRPGARWRVMISTSTGRIEEPLPEGEDQGVPTWSPDGQSLLYGDWPFGRSSAPMRLHILNLFTHHAVEVEGSETLWTPRWSPDGAYICAFRRNSAGLMLTRAGNASWREIMAGENLDDLTWSSDSKYIYLTANGPPRHLLRVHVLTGRVEQVADIGDFPSIQEHWFGVAPDGSPLALQLVPQEEIYSLHWTVP